MQNESRVKKLLQTLTPIEIVINCENNWEEILKDENVNDEFIKSLAIDFDTINNRVNKFMKLYNNQILNKEPI